MSRLKSKLLGGLFAALAASAAALAPAPAQEPAGVQGPENALLSRRISMGAGKSLIVDLPRDATEIVIGNPKVADAVVRSPRKLYIIGGESGQTTIFALDSNGRQVANLEISVGRDVGELGPLLKAALPKSDIIARTVNDVIILTGTVSSAGEAQRAVDIAKGFAKKAGALMAAANVGGVMANDGNIVNALTIRGEDQVMLKVTVAEVQRAIIKQLGVSAQTGGDTLLAGSWGRFTQQNPFSINGSFNTEAVFNGPNSTRATLRAFERYGVSRILAEPTVTAISGEAAKMLVGGQFPYMSGSNCQNGFCVASVDYKDYGVTLNFTPVVLSEGRILLRLATEVSELDRQNAVSIGLASVPGIKTRKHETTVELPSGGSIATAGLVMQNATQAINGLPGLLDVPVLGALFRSRDYQRNETELLVVVTPYIVKAVSSHEVSRPDEGFADASDPQAWLLGRVNRLYATSRNPQMIQNFKGRVGFIHD